MGGAGSGKDAGSCGDYAAAVVDLGCGVQIEAGMAMPGAIQAKHSWQCARGASIESNRRNTGRLPVPAGAAGNLRPGM